MRALPPGIRVQRAGPGDQRRVFTFVLAGIESYKEWAPDWTLPKPTPEARERSAANFASDDTWILMAFDGEELVGVVSMAIRTNAQKEPPPPGTIHLWQMFVAPAWQGSGLAGALIDLALEEALKRGFTRMTLWAAAGAAQARRFYEREGWTVCGNDDDSDFGLPLVQYERGLA